MMSARAPSAAAIQQFACYPSHAAPCDARLGCLPHTPSRGCVDPPPTSPGGISKQCSFPLHTAMELCSRWPQCVALNCLGGRGLCQARSNVPPMPLAHTFGDSDAFVHVKRANSTDAAKAAALLFAASRTQSHPKFVLRAPAAACLARWTETSAYTGGGVRGLQCSGSASNTTSCTLTPSSSLLSHGVLDAVARLRRIREGVASAASDGGPPPLLMFMPTPASPAPRGKAARLLGGGAPESAAALATATLPGERRTYSSTFCNDHFVSDAVYVYEV